MILMILFLLDIFLVLNNKLQKLDCIDPSTGNIHYCIDTAKFILYTCPTGFSCCTSNDTRPIIPDNGATFHILTKKDEFDPTMYNHCKNVFILMRDATKVSVIGYNTGYIKLDRTRSSLAPGVHCTLKPFLKLLKFAWLDRFYVIYVQYVL